MENIERQILQKSAGRFCRNPQQVNAIFEADAEIVRLPGKQARYLVAKTDGIHEEIKEKLYLDPNLIGWMAVTAPVSDIAAVTAKPLGILFSIIQPTYTDEAWMQSFSEGVNEACEQYGIQVLGGDTSFDTHFSVSATVLTAILRRRPLMRTGINPGDYLYATGKMGLGNAFAYARYFDPTLHVEYKPKARIQESSLISKYASACMDTSDGLFPCLALLSELNGLGFRLEKPLAELLTEQALSIVDQTQLPEWIFLAGPHGEYELVFSVPASKHANFLNYSKKKHFQPIFLGQALSDPLLKFQTRDMHVSCQPALIPNLYYKNHDDVRCYFESLLKQHQLWKIQTEQWNPATTISDPSI